VREARASYRVVHLTGISSIYARHCLHWPGLASVAIRLCGAGTGAALIVLIVLWVPWPPLIRIYPWGHVSVLICGV
jgi:hypothetical protein